MAKGNANYPHCDPVLLYYHSQDHIFYIISDDADTPFPDHQ
ncbi:hypothetical protein yrohd0001_39450 [Yersinia rohdei ATCC 43380]|nr:hypothetical protein yrohd0001_39450 [Yersinia rohdei ATCC 43380]